MNGWGRGREGDGVVLSRSLLQVPISKFPYIVREAVRQKSIIKPAKSNGWAAMKIFRLRRPHQCEQENVKDKSIIFERKTGSQEGCKVSDILRQKVIFFSDELYEQCIETGGEMSERSDVYIHTCGHCKAANNFLADHGVAICTDVDLLTGDERKAMIEEVKKYNPACSFPTILIGERIIVGFNEQAIREALGL
jgi:glutaredoxin